MDPDDWSKVLLAAIPVVGAVAKLLRGAVPGRRGRLVSDADLLAKLPRDSAAYDRLLGHLDDEVAPDELGGGADGERPRPGVLPRLDSVTGHGLFASA